jgi:hypothetical protein
VNGKVFLKKNLNVFIDFFLSTGFNSVHFEDPDLIEVANEDDSENEDEINKAACDDETCVSCHPVASCLPLDDEDLESDDCWFRFYICLMCFVAMGYAMFGYIQYQRYLKRIFDEEQGDRGNV